MYQDPFTVKYKHRKHFRVMVRVADYCASDLGSILGKIRKYFENSIQLNFFN